MNTVKLTFQNYALLTIYKKNTHSKNNRAVTLEI